MVSVSVALTDFTHSEFRQEEEGRKQEGVTLVSENRFFPGDFS